MFPQNRSKPISFHGSFRKSVRSCPSYAICTQFLGASFGNLWKFVVLRGFDVHCERPDSGEAEPTVDPIAYRWSISHIKLFDWCAPILPLVDLIKPNFSLTSLSYVYGKFCLQIAKKYANIFAYLRAMGPRAMNVLTGYLHVVIAFYYEIWLSPMWHLLNIAILNLTLLNVNIIYYQHQFRQKV